MLSVEGGSSFVQMVPELVSERKDVLFIGGKVECEEKVSVPAECWKVFLKQLKKNAFTVKCVLCLKRILSL